MPSVPKLQRPREYPDPARSLAKRIGAALGIIGAIALITWIGRDGYRDDAGSSLSVLDALYYATVTVTTTGYGDITPVDPAARLITALVVAPLRILFLVVLVGTTLEMLTERFRDARAEARWRARMQQHIVIVGFGTTGRGAAQTLLTNGLPPDRILVIDPDPASTAAASRAGFASICADGATTAALRQAQLDTASALIVTCNRDDTATLVTLTARELTPFLPISVAVREEENANLLTRSGATSVVLSSEAVGRLIGLSTSAPAAVSVLEDLLSAGTGLTIGERPSAPCEIGRAPARNGNQVPIAIVRNGRRIDFDNPNFQGVRADDIVVFIASHSS